jgi:hypothetical protein
MINRGREIRYLKGTIDFLADFGASEDDFARDKDQQNDLWIDHSVNQTREQFWFILLLAQ